jgi:hypothetical protein
VKLAAVLIGSSINIIFRFLQIWVSHIWSKFSFSDRFIEISTYISKVKGIFHQKMESFFFNIFFDTSFIYVLARAFFSMRRQPIRKRKSLWQREFLYRLNWSFNRVNNLVLRRPPRLFFSNLEKTRPGWLGRRDKKKRKHGYKMPKRFAKWAFLFSTLDNIGFLFHGINHPLRPFLLGTLFALWGQRKRMPTRKSQRVFKFRHAVIFIVIDVFIMILHLLFGKSLQSHYPSTPYDAHKRFPKNESPDEFVEVPGLEDIEMKHEGVLNLVRDWKTTLVPNLREKYWKARESTLRFLGKIILDEFTLEDRLQAMAKEKEEKDKKFMRKWAFVSENPWRNKLKGNDFLGEFYEDEIIPWAINLIIVGESIDDFMEDEDTLPETEDLNFMIDYCEMESDIFSKDEERKKAALKKRWYLEMALRNYIFERRAKQYAHILKRDKLVDFMDEETLD